MKKAKGYLALTFILVLMLSVGCTGWTNDNNNDDNNNLNPTGSGVTSSGALNNRYSLSTNNTRTNGIDNDYNLNNQITPYNTTNNGTTNNAANTRNNTTTTRSGVNTNIGSAYNQ